MNAFPIRAGRAGSAPAAPALRASARNWLWGLGAVVLGLALGLAVSLQQTPIALAIVLLPAVVALFMHPDWLPAVLLATAFGESISTGGVTLSRLTGPLALLIMILTLPGWRSVRLPRVGLLLATLLYAAWAFASALWTVNPDSSLQNGGTGYALAALALSYVFMLGMAMFVQREYHLRRLVVLIWLFSAIAGTVSIAQYLGGYTRSLGLSGDANFFAAIQVIALPFEALLANQVRTGRARVIVLLGLTATVGSIVTSLSRGGILALAAIFLLLALQPARTFFQSPRQKRIFLGVAALGAAVLLAASFSALSARTSSLFTTGDGGSGRTNLWLSALTGWRAHPVNGMGFGAFIGQSNKLLLATPGVNFGDYRLRPGGQVVHNVYLETLTELGVIGLILFLAVLVTMVLTLRSTAREAAAADQRYISSFTRAMMLAVAGFAFTSVFLSTETNRTFWILLGLTVALPRVLVNELASRTITDTAAADDSAMAAGHFGNGRPGPIPIRSAGHHEGAGNWSGSA